MKKPRPHFEPLLHVRFPLLAALIAVAAIACSAGPGGRTGEVGVYRDKGTDGGSTHRDASFGNPEGGAPTGPSGSGGATTDAASQDDGSLNNGSACAVGTARAELKPVNMLVMFDRSGSMKNDDKWPNATAALTSFFENPGAAGLRVALRFFPHDEPADGCTDDGCDAVACSQPLVPIGTLTAEDAPADQQEAALVNAIQSSTPTDGGGTPIYAALDGSLRWAKSYQSAHPDEATVVIFVTDGEPNGCNEDFDDISMLASDAFASTGISTYAIGLQGASMDQMDQLAQAGGTSKGIFIDNSANAEQELLAALTAIRGATLSCDFPMPKATDANMAIDPAKINVTFTPQSGSAATLGQKPGKTDCGKSKAWYYDSPASPKRIMLCPAACDLVQANPDAKLEILVGCKTACGGLDEACGGIPPDVPPIIPD